MTWTDKRYHHHKGTGGHRGGGRYEGIARPSFWGWPLGLVGDVARGVAGAFDGDENQHQRERTRRYGRSQDGGHILSGMKSTEEVEVETLQREMNEIMGRMFKDDAPILNVDGRYGNDPEKGATGRVESALNEFYNTMLEGTEVPPNATLSEKNALLNKLRQEIAERKETNKNSEEADTFDQKMAAAFETVGTKIREASNSDLPNGFSKPMGGEAAAPAAEGGKGGKPVTTAPAEPLEGTESQREALKGLLGEKIEGQSIEAKKKIEPPRANF